MTASKLIINGEEHNLGGTRRYRTLEVDFTIPPQGYLEQHFNRGSEMCCKITDNLGPLEVGDVLVISEEGEAQSYPEGAKKGDNSGEEKGGAKVYPITLVLSTSLGVYDENGDLLQEFYCMPFSGGRDYLINSFEYYLYLKEEQYSNPTVAVGPTTDHYITIGEISNLEVQCEESGKGPFKIFLLYSAGYANSVIPSALN